MYTLRNVKIILKCVEKRFFNIYYYKRRREIYEKNLDKTQIRGEKTRDSQVLQISTKFQHLF